MVELLGNAESLWELTIKYEPASDARSEALKIIERVRLWYDSKFRFVIIPIEKLRELHKADKRCTPL